MSAQPWRVSDEVMNLVVSLQGKYHYPRLEEASVVACFEDSKPFVKNRINLGRVVKFTPLAQLWQQNQHDFCITVCADLWHDVLSEEQRPALLDLLLSRCEVEYLPETIIENGKKKVLKDDWGRIKYTNEIKRDEGGKPKWQIAPLDLEILTGNVRRFGLWLDELSSLKAAIDYNLREQGNVD